MLLVYMEESSSIHKLSMLCLMSMYSILGDVIVN